MIFKLLVSCALSNFCKFSHLKFNFKDNRYLKLLPFAIRYRNLSSSAGSLEILEETEKSAMENEAEIQSLEHSSVMSTQSDVQTPPIKSHSIFESPVSSTSNKVTVTHYSTSQKRKFSASEYDYPNLCMFSNRKSTGLIETSNFNVDHSWKRTYNRGRRSLPIEKAFTTSNHQLDTNHSLVGPHLFQVSPHTPNHSSNQSCNGDITPYSPAHTPKRFRPALPFPHQLDLTNYKSDSGFIDSHCHLDFLFQRQGHEGSYKDYMTEHRSTFPDCYKGCLAIFCNPHSFNKKELWENYLEEENVWASFGCHPHNARNYNDEVEKSLRVAVEHPKVKALGEIGLDYSNRNNCLRTLQHEAFKRQLKIAIEKDLPLVIHCRNAHEDCMTIMKEIVPKEYLIHLHCFTDTWVLADKWLQEFPNLFIGITNVVTFPSAESVHEVARKIPLDRLLLETDAPYFIPKPLLKNHPDTRYSHPGMAIYVAAQIAALRCESLEKVLRHTRQNTKRMYKI